MNPFTFCFLVGNSSPGSGALGTRRYLGGNENFKLFAFRFLLSSFLYYLCSPFGLRGTGCGPKGLGNRTETLKQTGVAQLVE